MEPRYEDDEFYPNPVPRAPWAAHRRDVSVDADEFFPRDAPPEEPGWLARAAARPVAFGALLFAVGWAGILLQLGFFRQLVVGAPVFEELAKFGPPLVIVTILGATRVWSRLPWAWVSGAAFGVFEHYATYSVEPLVVYAERVAFHAGATGLSMALYTAVERVPDVRARWVSTIPATVIHWGNNFGALVFAFFSVFLPFMEEVSLGWALLMTTSTFVLTVAIALDQEGSRRRFAGVAAMLVRRMAGAHAAAALSGRGPTTSSGAEEAAAARASAPPEAPR